MKKNKGFTLVELMTVIMIIAILATVVLVSLDTARKRARDSAIQTQVAQIRSLAETVYELGGDGYKEFHLLATEVTHQEHSSYRRAKEKIEELGVDTSVTNDFGLKFTEDITVGAGYGEYCMYVRLTLNEDDVFCVDSRGIADTIDTDENTVNCINDVEPNCDYTTP